MEVSRRFAKPADHSSLKTKLVESGALGNRPASAGDKRHAVDPAGIETRRVWERNGIDFSIHHYWTRSQKGYWVIQR